MTKILNFSLMKINYLYYLQYPISHILSSLKAWKSDQTPYFFT